jgi:hypothetical protein
MLQQTYYAIFQFMKPAELNAGKKLDGFGYNIAMKQRHEWPPAILLQSPLFAPLHPLLERIKSTEFPTLHEWNSLLESHYQGLVVQSGHALRFVAQAQGRLGFESQYEPRCYLSGEVQTRENNWHDLFNALVWLTFPKAKAAINARHYQALKSADEAAGSQRGRVRDMATLLDESGVIVASADTGLTGLLHNFQWKELFWQRREQMHTNMGFYIFGHGLYEKALQPYVGMTGQGLSVRVEQEFFNWDLADRLAHLDKCVADYLNRPEHCKTTAELHPVPLLGVPGWTEANEQAAYYDNTTYFRAGRGNAAK